MGFGAPPFQVDDDTLEKVSGVVGLKTTTGTLAGNLAASTATLFVLGARVFFPMIHTSVANSDLGGMMGHTTDAADPDSGRFSIVNVSGNTYTYDVDYRRVG